MEWKRPYSWWNALFFLGVIIVNVLSVTLPIAGNSTAEISDMYKTYLTPAGYAFAIWSIIYLLLGGFVIYGFQSSSAARNSVQALGIWFVVSCICNMGWLLLWHYLHIELSLLAMVLLLASLIIIYRKTRIIPSPTTGQQWLVKLPFSIYLGWVSVATIVNVSIVLHKNNWDGFGISDSTWAVIMLIVGMLLAVLVSYPNRDCIYPLIFVWAYIAIALEHKEADYVFITALVTAGLLFLYSIWLLLTPNPKRISTNKSFI